ncbi:hypothetical protein KUL113_03520 [Tenacibaculum sp. KUL113]|nr:hypothetical protein KUL113_03520 [Tenacibaculum sp. KUL113]
MALETFSYPDGPALSAIPNSQVWTGSFDITNGLLKTSTDVANSRIVWPSLSENVWETTITRTGGSSGYCGLIFRGVDSQNYWALIVNLSSSGKTRLVKYVNGSGDIIYERNLDGLSNTINLKVRAFGDEIVAYVDDEKFKTHTDSTYEDGTFSGVRFDATGYETNRVLTPSEPVQTFNANKLNLTKLGILFNNHSLLTSAGATEEFWFHPFETSRIVGWPSARYPMIIYSSTDHATGKGGVFARLWDSDVGPITDPNAWLEWNQISNRPEFDHIVQKNEPIYQDPSHNQTETPTVDMLNGTLHMYYHTTTQSNPNNEYPVAVQNTHSATSTNGIDFTLSDRSVVTYNPKYEQGDGHTGYLNITVNPMPHIPFQYLANSTHGGGDLGRSPGQAIWGTDDFVNFERLKIWGRFQGELNDFIPDFPSGTEWIWILWDVGSIKPAGSYWRMVIMARPDVVGGGQDNYSRPVEVLVDDEFNIVSVPNAFIERGGDGEYDQLEIHHFKEMPYTGPNGERYAVYKALQQGDVTSCAIAQIEDVSADWQLLYPHSSRNVLHSYSEVSDFTLNTAASLIEGQIHQTVPALGSAIWEGDTITLSDHDVVDLVFHRQGKNGPEDLRGAVGFFDNIDAPLNQISLLWPDSAEPSTRMLFQRQSDGGAIEQEWSRKVIGFIGRGDLNNGEETVRSAHTYGIRILPKEKIAYVLDGVSRTTKHYLTDVDLTAPMKVGYKFTNPSVNDDSIRIESAEVVTYSNTLSVSNNRPTATITGTNIDYAPNSTVPLVCEAEDLDGDTLTYFWEQLSNGAPAITIADPNSASTSFLAEAEDANIAVRCTVSDGTDSVIASATFYITEGSNAAPTVTITASKTTVEAGEQFTVTANAVDTDGTISSYLWEQVNNGAGSVTISNPNSATTNVTAFSSSNQQTAKLRVTVTDDDQAVGSREVDVVVLPLEITPPTVVLGPNQSVQSGETVYLDASQSTAGSHPIASYEWTQTAGDTVTLVNSTTATPEFIAPSENDAQTLTFSVVAIDTEGNRSTAKTVSIAVAAFTFDGSILELIDSVPFELVTDGNLMIYPGRANREIIKLRPGSDLGLVVDAEGCIDFESAPNNISKLEVIIYSSTEKAKIDSDSSAIVFEGSEAHCRFGDFQPKSAKEPFDVAVVLYISGDGRGVVVYSTSEALSTQGAASVSAYVQPSLGV